MWNMYVVGKAKELNSNWIKVKTHKKKRNVLDSHVYNYVSMNWLFSFVDGIFVSH